jgi:hypothetical protein
MEHALVFQAVEEASPAPNRKRFNFVVEWFSMRRKKTMQPSCNPFR